MQGAPYLLPIRLLPDVSAHSAKDDISVVADFDGNGRRRDSLCTEAANRVIDANRNRELNAHALVFEMGGSGDLPVVGARDGDAAIHEDLGPARSKSKPAARMKIVIANSVD